MRKIPDTPAAKLRTPENGYECRNPAGQQTCTLSFNLFPSFSSFIVSFSFYVSFLCFLVFAHVYVLVLN